MDTVLHLRPTCSNSTVMMTININNNRINLSLALRPLIPPVMTTCTVNPARNPFMAVATIRHAVTRRDRLRECDASLVVPRRTRKTRTTTTASPMEEVSVEVLHHLQWRLLPTTTTTTTDRPVNSVISIKMLSNINNIIILPNRHKNSTDTIKNRHRPMPTITTTTTTTLTMVIITLTSSSMLTTTTTTDLSSSTRTRRKQSIPTR
jgi:hypothetical protein